MSFITHGKHGSVERGSACNPTLNKLGRKYHHPLNVRKKMATSSQPVLISLWLYHLCCCDPNHWNAWKNCGVSYSVYRKSKRIVRARTGTRTNYVLIIINLPPPSPHFRVYMHVNKYAYIPANINIVATFLYQTYWEHERRVKVSDLTECMYC